MNIVVFQENLLRQLTLASRFLPLKSTTIPVLNSFLLTAKDGVITILASNIETTITTTVPGKIEQEGKALLPAKTILSLIPTLAGEKITLALDGKRLLVKSEKAEVFLNTEDADDYPQIKNYDVKQTIAISRNLLLDIVQKVVVAASSDPMRAILTSVLVVSEGKKISSVATDGFRLAKLEKSFDKELVFPPTPFPAKVIEALASIIKESDLKEIPVSFLGEGGQVLFSLGSITLYTQTVQGNFPDYQRIVPTSTTTRVLVQRDEFLRAVRFAAVLAREAANIIRLAVKGNVLVVSANAPQTGENKMTMAVEKEGEDVEAAFNYRFLLDFLSAAASSEGEVVFETNGSLSPGMFRFEKEKGYFYIVMPVRLQES